MNCSFVIYDYETFGKNVALDRPAQFAGLRVDHQLENIESKEVFFCKLADDYLVDPEAVLINGITPQKALHNGIIEAEFAKRIHQFFSKPNTCIIGYNNIRFDDEYSRNILYRNFYDPYGWSWKQENSRWDLLDVMRAIHDFSPEGIKWPRRDDGIYSFKLEDLAIANNIEHINAHDADSDVHATLELMKLVRKRKPVLFKDLYDHRHKNTLKKIINCDKMSPLVHVSGKFSNPKGNTALIAPIAYHPKYDTQIISCNLSGNMSVLQDLNSTQLEERLFTKHGILGSLSPVPLKLVHLNKCPVLSSMDRFDEKDFERWGIDYNQCLDNLSLLRKQTDLQDKVKSIFSKPFPKSQDVDSQLYDGFFSDKDREIMNLILDVKPEKLSKLDVSFFDRRLPELLFRYRARNFPHTLNYKEKQKWLEHRKNVFNSLRVEEYRNKLYELSNIHKEDAKKQKLISSLFEYLKNIVPN
ncbi:exodeoxyribonuclease I [Candidatus Liberibacter brunswickensis]|uniref:exodeoxyribonuclease I n=1 Tax=Candidatus Liberibacter brunswickensis TaxID=1968796 RepID=UPI002FDFFA17